MGHPFPLKIIHSHGGSGPLRVWFQVYNPNGILIGSAIFARLMSVTDRQTDKQTMLIHLQQ